MAKCTKCGMRKGKRQCRALEAMVCSKCCGEYRGRDLQCPPDCAFFEQSGDTSHQTDIVEKLALFSRHHDRFMQMAFDVFSCGLEVQQWEMLNAIAHGLYVFRGSGDETLAEIYRRERAGLLSMRHREALDALIESRFSMYRVEKVHRDQGLDVEDMVSGDRLFVHEKLATHQAMPGDTVLTWIQFSVGRYVFTGAMCPVLRLHRKLTLDNLRSELTRARKRWPDAPEYVIRSRVVAPLHVQLRNDVMSASAPELRNTDDEQLVFCKATWDLTDRQAARSILDGHPDIDLVESGRGATSFKWLGHNPDARFKLPGGVALGTIELSGESMTIEVNSRERLERATRMFEKLMGPAIENRRVDEESLEQSAIRVGAMADESPDPFADLDEKQRETVYEQINKTLMQGWLDSKLPVLGGLTPRQAVHDPDLVPTVIEIIEDQQNMFSHSQNREVDLSWMFEELGIDVRRPPTPGPEPDDVIEIHDDDESGQTREAIHHLLDNPPDSPEQLKRILDKLDAHEARDVFVDALEIASVENVDLIQASLRHLGPGLEYDRLFNIATDASRDDLVRSVAMMAIGTSDRRLVLALDEQGRMLLTARIFEHVFDALLNESDAGAQVSDLLLHSDPVIALFDDLERARIYSAVPASVVYAHAVHDPRLAELRFEIVDALVKEGGFWALRIIENIRDVDRAHQRELTHAIEACEAATSVPPPAEGFLWACDGQGAFILLLVIAREDGRCHAANLVIRAADGIRDGFVAAHRSRRQIDDLVEHMTTSTGPAVPIDPAHAAQLVLDALGRNPHVVDQAAGAISLFGLYTPVPVTGPEPAARVAKRDLESILDSPPYMSSWFLDQGDLRDFDPDHPSKPLHQRIVAMAEHMAMYHKLAGQHAWAAIMGRSAIDTRDGFASSALVSVLLDRSSRLPAQPARPTFDDPSIRRSIRGGFFSDVKSPRGMAMAQLDFAVYAFLVLEDQYSRIPGDKRPPVPALERLSFEIGTEAATHFIKLSKGALGKRIHKILLTSTLVDPDQASHFASTLEALLFYYRDTICDMCPVHCISNARFGTSDHFQRDVHPMLHGESPIHRS